MAQSVTRREVIKGGVMLASVAGLGRWRWLLPSLQQGEEVVPWTDVPANFTPGNSLDTRLLRKEDFLTPVESFYLVQHYGPQQVDAATWRLREPGLEKKPMELTLDELK